VDRLAASQDVEITNYGINGSGVEYQSKKINEVMPVDNNDVVLLAAGLNDLQITGATTKNYYKIQECYRHAITSSFISSFTPANDDAIDITGATSVVPISGDVFTKPRSQYVEDGEMLVTFGNATITYDFTGTNIGFMFMHNASIYTGSPHIQVWIDGDSIESVVTTGLVEGAAYTGGGSDMPGVRTYRGLSSGSHTIELRCRSFSDVNARFHFDGFYTVKSPGASPVIAVGSPCYMMQARYDVLASGGITLNNTIINVARDSIFAVADEFIALGYDVRKVDQNLYRGTLTVGVNMDDDDIHPNDTGHRNIWQSWDEVF
jgi:hypothetical protein